MRSIKAKALRKLAQKSTIGEPAIAYQIRKNGENSSIITLNPNCTRAVYKKLKKSA